MAVELLGTWGTGSSHATAAGDNRVMILFIHTEHSGITIPQAEVVEYGATDMLRVPVPAAAAGLVSSADTDDNFQCTTEAWYMPDATLDVVPNADFFVQWEISVGDPDLELLSHVLLQGVDQNSPFGEGLTSFISEATPSTISTTAPLSSNDKDMVMWAATSGNDGTYTPLNSFTEGTDQLTASHTGATGYKDSTGADETPSATYDGPGNANRQTMYAFTVQQQVAVRPQDSFTFADQIAAHNTNTLTIGDSSEPDQVDDLDRGVTVDAGGGNVIQQRSQNDVIGPFADNLAHGFTFEIAIQEALVFLDSLIRNVHNVATLPETFTLLENLSAIVTEGDGWVRIGTPVGTWAAAPAPDTGSRPQTLGTFTDVSGGIDFIPVLASGAKGGPYWRVATDRPTTLRSKSNITSDPNLRP